MFSRLIDSARNILRSSQTPPASSTTSTLDPQIPGPPSSPPPPSLTDQAPIADMVTTRRGQNYELDSPVVPSSGRKTGVKRGNEDDATPVKSKRRRAVAVEVTVESPTARDGDSTIMDDERPDEDQTDQNLPVPKEQSSAEKLRESPAVVVKLPTRSRKSGEEPESDTIAGADTTADPEKEVEQAQNPVSPPKAAAEAEGAVFETPQSSYAASVYTTPATHIKSLSTIKNTFNSAKGSISKRKRALMADDATPIANTSKMTSKSNLQSPKRSHIRFGSEDPLPAIDETSLHEIPSSTFDSVQQDLSDSDDEAPEAVTHSSALQQAKAAQAEAEQAIEKKKDVEKQKRRERGERLKEQTQARREREEKTKAAASIDDAEAVANQAIASFTFDSIPALLPESLLEAVGDERPPTPPPAVLAEASGKQAGRGKRIIFADKGPKDVQRGPVRVHVLEQGNGLLAPKKTGNAGWTREHWMRGRNGRKVKGRRADESGAGGSKLERRKVHGGFLRK